MGTSTPLVNLDLISVILILYFQNTHTQPNNHEKFTLFIYTTFNCNLM